MLSNLVLVLESFVFELTIIETDLLFYHSLV